MKIIHTPRQMFALSQRARLKNKTIGLVPTMGAIHAGHLSLIRAARRANDYLVVSIFVNPAQFGAGEDFNQYPRNFQIDAALCRKEKVDVLFCPTVRQMYPGGFCTFVKVEGLSEVLCGASRPVHFRGVATVVAKLFNLINPHTAYFGQKDAQQVAVIRRLVKDLNFPVKIQALPTVRSRDGLALSSRNLYLSPKQRIDALVLSEALELARDLIRGGRRDSVEIIAKMRQMIRRRKSAKIDYVALVNPDTLIPLKKIKGSCLIALAVYIGKTRLIDNIIINV